VSARELNHEAKALAAGDSRRQCPHGFGLCALENFTRTGARPDSLLLRDCGILKAKDMPPSMLFLIEVPDEVGGYGAKGTGEIGLVPTAGAVAGALYSYDGIRRFSLPHGRLSGAAPSVPKSRRKTTVSVREVNLLPLRSPNFPGPISSPSDDYFFPQNRGAAAGRADICRAAAISGANCLPTESVMKPAKRFSAASRSSTMANRTELPSTAPCMARGDVFCMP